jgi:hypothetical protein
MIQMDSWRRFLRKWAISIVFPVLAQIGLTQAVNALGKLSPEGYFDVKAISLGARRLMLAI